MKTKPPSFYWFEEGARPKARRLARMCGVYTTARFLAKQHCPLDVALWMLATKHDDIPTPPATTITLLPVDLNNDGTVRVARNDGSYRVRERAAYGLLAA